MPDAREVVDRFFAIRLGISVEDIKLGQVAVAASDRRTFAERGHGFIRLLWIVHFGDRAAVSVHPAALAEVSRLAWKRTPDQLMSDDFHLRAADALEAALPGASLNSAGHSVVFCHPGDAAPIPTHGDVRTLTVAAQALWAGKRVYPHAVAHPAVERGEAFGLFLDDKLIAEIITHEPSVAEMANLVAEDGIEVAENYRGCGHGKALLAAWTCEMQARGRVCIHSTSPGNAASIALAQSVGYVEHARTRAVTHTSPEQQP